MVVLRVSLPVDDANGDAPLGHFRDRVRDCLIGSYDDHFM